MVAFDDDSLVGFSQHSTVGDDLHVEFGSVVEETFGGCSERSHADETQIVPHEPRCGSGSLSL